MTAAHDLPHMQAALALARRGLGNTWPNPSVGCVIVKDGRVLWPTLSYDGKLFVFERDFTIWKMDPNNAKATAIPIHLRGAAPRTAISVRS